MKTKDISQEAMVILNMWRDGKAQIQWIALDAFRIWFKRPYIDEDGCAGIEIGSKDFQIKELK